MPRSREPDSHLVPPEHEPAQQVRRQAELGDAVSVRCAGTERFRAAPCARPVPARRPARRRGRLPPAPAAIHYSSRMLQSWIGGWEGEEEKKILRTTEDLVVRELFLSRQNNNKKKSPKTKQQLQVGDACALAEDRTNLQLQTQGGRAFFQNKSRL